MSLGEEDDEPNRGAGPSAQGEGAGAGPQGSGPQGSGPATPGVIPVIVAGDGSASIDGIPVPVMGGESVDVAILDTLHGYARNRDTTVTASISDPAAGYVAIVEVAPDGSSRLVEQHQNDTPEDAGTEQPTSPTADPVAPIFVIDSEDGPDPAAPPSPRSEQPLEQIDFSDTDDDDFAPGYDADDDDEEEAVAIVPERARPRISAPTLSVPSIGLGNVRSNLGNVRSKLQRQSDDEYEPPAFLKRPLGIGIAGVVAAAVVIVPLVMLGSGSGGGTGDAAGQNQAAESSTVKDTTPPTPLELTPSYSPSPSLSPSLSPSPSRSPSPSASPSKKAKEKTKAKPKATSGPKAKPKSTPKPKAKSKPKSTPKTTKPAGIPTGRVLIKNKKYGFCVDLPGEGSVGVDTRVQDYRCKPSGDNQDWVLDLVSRSGGTGGASLYLIRNVSSNLCLDLPNFGTVLAQTPVSVFHCRPGRETDNQLWWLKKRPNGTYWIRNQKSGDMCLDVARTNRTAETTNVTVYPCNARDDHEWSFPKS
ncbi:RICIN domain-containing protein [Streptomyces sp. NPDC050535]|uniref:RICIN domain-containing protein n=1 Tax=Streptomyces sp. NPDC050535 TaxID=3365626 RepID=UPI00378A566C